MKITATVRKPVMFIDIAEQITNVYELLSTFPKININNKEKFLARAEQLQLLEVIGNPKDVKIGVVVDLLNTYLLYDKAKIIINKKSTYNSSVSKKYYISYNFTVIEIS